MSYIDKNMLADEKILFRTKKSLVIFTYPIIWTIFSIFATFYMPQFDFLEKLIWAPWLVAFIAWFYTWLEYATSDFVVTNKRVMMKEGFFVRHTTELRLTAVAQVQVDQSLLGQMFDYGVVSINAFGAYDAFSVIARPFQFQKAVNEQLDKLVS